MLINFYSVTLVSSTRIMKAGKFSVNQWMWTALNLLPMLMVAGYYLSFFFTVSHNFRGVHLHEDTRRETNHMNSFLYNQVR